MEAYCAFLEERNQQAIAAMQAAKTSSVKNIFKAFHHYAECAEMEGRLATERHRHALTRSTRNRVIKERNDLRDEVNSDDFRMKVKDNILLGRQMVIDSLKAEIENLTAHADELAKAKDDLVDEVERLKNSSYYEQTQ